MYIATKRRRRPKSRLPTAKRSKLLVNSNELCMMLYSGWRLRSRENILYNYFNIHKIMFIIN